MSLGSHHNVVVGLSLKSSFAFLENVTPGRVKSLKNLYNIWARSLYGLAFDVVVVLLICWQLGRYLTSRTLRLYFRLWLPENGISSSKGYSNSWLCPLTEWLSHRALAVMLPSNPLKVHNWEFRFQGRSSSKYSWKTKPPCNLIYTTDMPSQVPSNSEVMKRRIEIKFRMFTGITEQCIRRRTVPTPAHQLDFD